MGWPRNSRKAWNLQVKGNTTLLYRHPLVETNIKRSLKLKFTERIFAKTKVTVTILGKCNTHSYLYELHPNIPVDYSSMYNLQNNNSFCAVFEKIWHFLFQCWLHLMFRNDLKVIPWGFAPSLHLGQIVLKLVKVHLTTAISETELTIGRWGIEEIWHFVFINVNKANLCQAGDSSYLGVQVSAVWKLLHHDRAGVMQQRLLMNCVLHLRDFFQVAQLKAFSLEMHAHTATHSECGTETTVWD